MLVANKTDQYGDRMVTIEDGQRRYREIDCVGFREISVRESIEQVSCFGDFKNKISFLFRFFFKYSFLFVFFLLHFNLKVWGVFHDVCQMWQVFSKCPKLKRSTSDVQTGSDVMLSPESTICSIFDSNMRVQNRRSFLIGNWNERSPDECEEINKNSESSGSSKNDVVSVPFRERASTDGTIFSRPRRWHYPSRVSVVSHPARNERRMSISMRGSNASY